MLAFPHALTPVLEVQDLGISYVLDDGWRQVVQSVSFSVGAGEVVALVGESGSGKTTTAQAVIGLLPDNGRIDSGSIRLNQAELSSWSPRRFDAIRGKVVSLIPQDPGTSLNPVQTIGRQVEEILFLHGWRDRKARRQRVIELLSRVGLSEPELRYNQYPHELSGGMKQRVLIAIAVALKPALIIADEPTSALDVTVQHRILDLIDELRAESGTSVLLVTHDLGVAADRADRIVVLRQGEVQEQGVTRALLAAPTSDYARQLLADAPSLAPASFKPLPKASEPAVTVEGLRQVFSVGNRHLVAVDDVSFSIAPGTTHALVGESGSGKTTTARAIVGLQKPTSGSIVIHGVEATDLVGDARRAFRRNVQLVYQNPFASLDPRQTIIDIVGEPLRNFGSLSRKARDERAAALIDKVGLPADVLSRNPRALSGGQRQRVAIARALILEPRFLVLDEAVSALDVTVQAQILKLLGDLQDQLGLTYLFVTHDLSVVRQIAHTVTVMQGGKAVETGPVSEVFTRPRTDYTRALLAAIPGRALAQSKKLEFAGAAE
ncbi:MAG: ABC transporter ATP-binding protein [Candidatus Devosia phytovorans]|uniref:ABC transporter ATP-binding protein n=1 Tax=Candidatus Devosia phytovorans TaxID=3121372 RepID=A0AAJ5VYF3_9HYPH|nr:ABC transporter ATP-binding protein [Devosia sp.]WEK06747.1 MAG: ABC transporter ATP-binding protein [Devosia sp.]